MAGVSDERAIWLAAHVLPHEPALRAWLRGRKVFDLEVDDVVQETYARLAALDSVEEIREPKRYMFQTAYSMIAQHLRRSRVVSISTMGDLDTLGFASPEASAEQQLIHKNELRDLAVALASLPEPCRTAFTLRRVNGLSQRETAEMLGISEKTVEKYMTKSIRFLMDTFGRGGKSANRASNADRESPLDENENKTVEPGR